MNVILGGRGSRRLRMRLLSPVVQKYEDISYTGRRTAETKNHGRFDIEVALKNTNDNSGPSKYGSLGLLPMTIGSVGMALFTLIQ